MEDFEYVNEIRSFINSSIAFRGTLLEERGVNPAFDNVIQRIKHVIMSYKQYFSFKVPLQVKDIRIKNSFIDKVRIELEFRTTYNVKNDILSYFNHDNIKMIKDNDRYVMLYPMFGFIQYANKYVRNITVNYQNLDNVLWHELMHCYRTYSIILKSPDMFIPKPIEKSDIRYERALNLRSNMENTNIGKLRKYIGGIYYLMNIDEISARISSIYGFIKNNEEINISNWQDYIEQMDIKKTYNQIYQFYQYLNDIKEGNVSEDEKKCALYILKHDLFDMPDKSDKYILNKTISNVEYYLSYINNKMYSAIQYSLQHLNRNGMTMEFYMRAMEEEIEKPIWN